MATPSPAVAMRFSRVAMSPDAAMLPAVAVSLISPGDESLPPSDRSRWAAIVTALAWRSPPMATELPAVIDASPAALAAPPRLALPDAESTAREPLLSSLPARSTPACPRKPRLPAACRSPPPAMLPVSAVLESPDIRAGMALLLAALCAEGTSVINNVGQIERGYERIDERLNKLGAAITRVDDRRQ